MTSHRQVPGQLALPLVAAMSAKQRAEVGRHIGRDWRERAECLGRDTDEFYPEADVPRISDPKDRCAFCPVARSCLASALLHDEEGVWGRTTEAERDELRDDITRGIPVAIVLDDALLGPISEWRD